MVDVVFVAPYAMEATNRFLAAFLANFMAGTLGFFWFRYAMKPYFETAPEPEPA